MAARKSTACSAKVGYTISDDEVAALRDLRAWDYGEHSD